MKASSKLKSAVSAAALSVGFVLPSATILQLATTLEVQAAVVRSVQVTGNVRVEASTIRSYIGIEPGKNFSPSDIDEAVKRLFGTGLFSDVSINQRGSVLVVQVAEYQVVNNVLFQGNKKIKDDVLAGRVQTRARSPYMPSTLEIDVETIKDSYRKIGRSDAIVTTEIMQVGENRVNVIFNIQEGGRTKISTVDFVGNNAFSDRRLREVIATKKSTLLSFLMRDDVYDENRLRADEEALRRFYYNRGYADFRIISSNAVLDENENEYVVTFTVDEGERYTFGDVAVESSIPGVDADELARKIKTRQGKVYSAKDVEKSIVGITEEVAGNGYAFAQVTPRGDRDFSNRTISVVYTVDQGPRTYVERIEIRGNNRTRDYVIRREFDVAEGDAFNQVLIQRAKRRLEDLDFFETVNISTQQGSDGDQVVVIVDVKEKATGEFSIGAGYTTGGASPGPQLSASITERNFLGRGQFIKLSVGGGQDSRDYALSFTEPYFLGRRIAAGFDLSRSTRDTTTYGSEVTSGTVRFGLPITDNLSTTVAYNLSNENYYKLKKVANIPLATQDAITNSPWLKSSISGTLTFNTIDNMKDPRNGIYATTTAEFAGLGGDAKYMKFTARGQYYQTLQEELGLVGLVTAGAGHVSTYGNSPLRQFDLFQSSDRIIRGFAANGIGPWQYRSAALNRYSHIGGDTYLNASAELQFPLPLLPEAFGMRGAVFADIGTVFGLPYSNKNFTGARGVAMDWRSSVGASLIWQSPFGPLRVDYAVPVMKQKRDVIENFNFGISGRF
ncbi:MAG: outer membrane protein assembly factor BamA [Notoacmeibacter sp.]|nr:outer membrane protein assembly factor BamA [Notoacmeibacter sp.]